MEKYLPKMYKNLMEIYKEVGTENEEESINEQYNLIEGISVDFGIMQKTRKGYVIKCEFVYSYLSKLYTMKTINFYDII